MARQIVERQLHRSRDAHLAGVCAGIAEYFDLDAIVIRILVILLTMTTCGIAGIAYLALWAYLPREPESAVLYDVMPEQAESSAFGKLDCLAACGMARSSAAGPSLIARLAVAVALMLVFMVVAVNATPIVSGAEWWQFWPLILLMGGLCLIVVPIGEKWTTAWHAMGIAVMSVGASLLPISLGVTAWETIPCAFSQLWVFVVVSIALFALGLSRNVGSLMVAGALCFAAFCLIMLLGYSVPGDASAVLVFVPEGSSYKISVFGF